MAANPSGTETSLDAWLAAHQLTHLAAPLVAEGVDLDVLGELTEADLQSLGIGLGDRKRLLRAIRAGAGGPAPEPAVEVSSSPVESDWLLEALRTWPSPLAHPVREYRAETNPVLRLWLACDWAELLLRFVVFVRIGELRARGPLSPKLARELATRLGEPTLGKWKGMALALVQGAEDSVLAESEVYLRDVLMPLLDGASPTPEHSLSALRNRLAHGGGIGRGPAERLDEAWRQPLERAWRALSWLADVELLGAGADGVWRALSGRGGARADVATADPRGMVLRSRGRDVALWPFLLHCPPEGRQGVPVQQVYVRRGDVTLQYTALESDEHFQTDSDGSAYAVLNALFGAAEAAPRSAFVVRGFEQELRRDSERLLGRDREAAHLTTLIREEPSGVLWLSGRAGSGKSMLVARVACDLWDEARQDEIVLAYRFRAGDDRCTRRDFLQALLEQLAARVPIDVLVEALKTSDATRRTAALRVALRALEGTRLVVLLDGLDEIESSDPGFAAELLSLAAHGGRWLCAGRPESDLVAAFAQGPTCRWAYADGLPPLSEDGVRAMLLDKIGPLRKRLLQGDTDAAGAVQNAFIAKVSAAASGLPIYVTYVIGDILGGRMRALDAGEALPSTLDAYHAELLRRNSVGVIASVTTPLMALLAIAREPLSEPTLLHLLQKGRVLPDDPEAPDVLRRALGALASMVRSATTPDGERGFSLFHNSLRQHALASAEMRMPVVLAREVVLEACRQAGAQHATPKYLWRQGVPHLLEAECVAEAAGLLTTFSTLRKRLGALEAGGPEQARAAVRGVTRDISLLHPALRHSSPPPGLEAFERFWTHRVPVLERTAQTWAPSRLVLAAARQEPAGSELRLAAERVPTGSDARFVEGGAAVRRPMRSACVRTLEAHPAPVRAIARSRDGTVLVSGGANQDGSSSLIEWNPRDLDENPRLLEGDVGDVLSIALDATGSSALVAGSLGVGLFRLREARMVAFHAIEGVSCLAWDFERCLALAGLSSGAVVPLRVVPEGLDVLASWKASGPVRALEAMPSRQAWLVGGDSYLDIVDDTGGVLATCAGQVAPVVVLAACCDGRSAAAADESGRVVVWDLGTLSALREWSFAPDCAGGLSWNEQGTELCVGLTNGPSNYDVLDRTLRVLDVASGACVRCLVGQWDRIYGLALDQPARVLFSAGSDATIRVWDLDIPACELREPTDTIAIGSVRFIDSGKRILSASDDRRVRIWNAATLETETCIEGHEKVVWTAVAHPFAPILFSVSEDGTLRSWSLDGVELCRHDAPGERFFGVAVSPDGAWLAASVGEPDVGSRDVRVVIWHLPTGGAPSSWRGPADRLPSIAFSPDGSLLAAASWDAKVYVWKVETGECVHELECETSGGVVGIAFHPDGDRLVASHVVGGGVSVIDLGHVESIQRLEGHVQEVRRAAFTPSGEYLITGGDDDTLRLWRIDSATCCDVWPTDAWVTDIALTAGRSLVAGLMDGQLIAVECRDLAEGPAPARAVRPWIPTVGPGVLHGEGKWGDPVIACPWCGTSTFAPVEHPRSCPTCSGGWKAAPR